MIEISASKVTIVVGSLYIVMCIAVQTRTRRQEDHLVVNVPGGAEEKSKEQQTTSGRKDWLT